MDEPAEVLQSRGQIFGFEISERTPLTRRPAKIEKITRVTSSFKAWNCPHTLQLAKDRLCSHWSPPNSIAISVVTSKQEPRGHPELGKALDVIIVQMGDEDLIDLFGVYPAEIEILGRSPSHIE